VSGALKYAGVVDSMFLSPSQETRLLPAPAIVGAVVLCIFVYCCTVLRILAPCITTCVWTGSTIACYARRSLFHRSSQWRLRKPMRPMHFKNAFRAIKYSPHAVSALAVARRCRMPLAHALTPETRRRRNDGGNTGRMFGKSQQSISIALTSATELQ